MSRLLKPNIDAMQRHLQHLFGGVQVDGVVELSWTPPAKSGPNQSKYFDLTQLDVAVQFAHDVNNNEGQNIYLGPALRKPGLSGRSSDTDVVAATCVYADLDDENANLVAEQKFQHCPPTAIVVTGRHPYLRQQVWWRLAEPQHDLAAVRRLNEALARILGGDAKVVNPSRLMRLGGSVAWPKKKDRIPELTQFTLLSEAFHVQF